VRRLSVRGVTIVAVAAVAMVLATSATEAKPPTDNDTTRIIIDTDMALWWDDTAALAMANAFESQGEVEILGVVCNVKSVACAPAVDTINTYYGNGKIPVGATLGFEQDIFSDRYTSALAETFPHSVGDGTHVQDAVKLYRQLLSKAPDQSVVIVSLGGHTNLAALLVSQAGHGSGLSGYDLVAQKVSQLVVMDGEFPVASRAWTNTLLDPVATKYVVNGDWPTPIHWADAAIGFPLLVGDGVCDAHSDGPIRFVWDTLTGCGNSANDAAWDAIAMYYAVRGLGDGILGLAGEGGAAHADFWGAISWVDNPDRPDDRYLTVNDYTALTAEINELLELVPDN